MIAVISPLYAAIWGTLINELFGARPTANDTEFLEKLRKKDWGDGEKEPQDTSQPTAPPEVVNDNNEPNVVYREPSNFYDFNITFNFNTGGSDNQLPNRTGSRLPIEDATENLGQSDAQIVIGAPITLKQSIDSQTFGKLLWNPFENKKLKIKNIIDSNLNGKITDYGNEALERYVKYVLGYPEATDKPSIYDPMLLIAPSNLRGLSGKQGLIVGSKIIRLLTSYSTLRSLNVFVGVSDTIPKEYEIVDEHINYDFQDETITDFDLGHSKGLSGVLLAGLPKGQINWDDWIKAGINKTYEQDREDQIEAEVEDFPELIQLTLAQLYYRLGLEDYPYVVPESLTIEDTDNNDQNTVRLAHLTDLIEWSIKAFDDVIGQFPFKIRIEDNDLIATGDQTIEFSLPNIAETLAEFTGKLLQQEAETKVIMNIVLRLLAETGAVKQQAIKNYYLSIANQEYFGYKTAQKTKEVEFLFNPEVLLEDEENQTLAKALEPKTIKVAIEDNNDTNSLEKHMATLIESARITKAKNWRSFGDKATIAADIVSRFKSLSELADSLGLNIDANLEEFIESTEKGFADRTSQVDPQKPFGREYERRPKINRLENNGESS